MRSWVLFAAGVLAFGEDPVAALKSVQLPFDATYGYLPALLKTLQIPVESQMAVFSKTSLQSLRIEPANPRVLYFNDTVTVGWVRGGFLEISSLDPDRGMQYYALMQRPDERIVQREDCLNCHRSGNTLLRSVVSTPDGIPSHEINVDSRTPFNQLWGGWFVTGDTVPAHMGNTVVGHVGHPERKELMPDRKSDIVALMVFAHQMRMMNLLAHPDNINELVDHLLFLDETPLPGPIRGNSGFSEKFAAEGPRDRCERSLRQFDLKTRLMRYPCSYMIYTAAFDGLPVKEAVYRRMWAILSGAEPSRLTSADRNAVIQILRDTKAGLPSYFVSW